MSKSRSPSLGRAFKALAGAAGLLMSVAVTAAPTIKIGTVVWVGYGPFYVADQLDLYKKSGMKVELQVFNDPALITSSIVSGAIDGGMITYDQAVSAVARGSNMKVVMPIDYSNGGDAVVATDWIMTTTAEDTPEKGVETRITSATFSFGGSDTLLLQGVGLYPGEGATLKPATTLERAIVGGTGKYEGATGWVESTHNADDTWTHTFHID
jgi:hypothetical protein